MSLAQRAGLLVVLSAACAPSPPPPPVLPQAVPSAPSASAAPAAAPSVDDSFRAQAPAFEEAPPFMPAPALRAHLANAIPVWLLRQPSGYCTIDVVAFGGAMDLGAKRPDAVDVANEMLHAMERGTRAFPTHQIEDHLASLQMPAPSWYRRWDSSAYSVSVPCDRFADGAEVLAEVVLRPTFEKREFDRGVEQDAREIDNDTNDATKVAIAVLSRVAFGSHLYGSRQTARRTRTVTRGDVVALHSRVFDPSRLSIIVAGSVDLDTAKAALERSFGTAKAAVRSVTPIDAVSSNAPGPTVTVVDKPRSATAAIAVGYLGPAAGAADEEAARMALSISMASAIGRATRLRDELGLVPWTESVHWVGRAGGLLKWQSRAPVENVATVLKEADAIMQALGSTGPTAGEVDVQRRSMQSAAMRDFQTPAQSADLFAELLGRGQSEEELASEQARLVRLSPDDVRAAAARYLDHARMHVVVVGDLAALGAPLLALGWGSIEVRDVNGSVVPPGTPASSAR